MANTQSRRELLGLGLTAVVAVGCAPVATRLRAKARPEAFELPAGPTTPGYRLHNRAAFGPRPGDLAAYLKDGHEATVERLLRADEPEEVALNLLLSRLDILRIDSAELLDLPEEEALRQLQQAAILRAVYGRNPLKERMADFWTNHFNIYGRKGFAAWQKSADENGVIRANALGSFPDMLRASAKSPAMLGYLDGSQNVRGVPNENYARELLELHTLGIDGGYTQKDIQEVARCFTGWTLEDRFLHARGRFRFVPEHHDDGPKRLLGHTIPAGGGIEDGERVLEIVASHPSTARHLAKKLSLYIVGDDRGAERAAEAYLRTGGDICAMIRPLLDRKMLADAPPIIKRPLDLVASSLRALDADTDGGSALQAHLAAMGQPLYQWPMPDGYPVRADAWATSMLPRWNYAFALAEGRIGGTSVASLGLPEVVGALFGHRTRAGERLTDSIRESPIALGLCAPEFQWR